MSSSSDIEANAHSDRRIDRPLLLFSVLLLLAIVALVSVRPWRRPQVAWTSELPAALAEARTTHHLVFVEVGAEWCDPCRRMEHDTFTDAAVGRALAGLHPVHLNDDKSEVQLEMNAWGAIALPTHLLLNPDGTVHAQALGFMSPEEFLAWLSGASKQATS